LRSPIEKPSMPTAVLGRVLFVIEGILVLSSPLIMFWLSYRFGRIWGFAFGGAVLVWLLIDRKKQ
jgi:hypothetical protein